jgi:hypothetical protein
LKQSIGKAVNTAIRRNITYHLLIEILCSKQDKEYKIKMLKTEDLVGNLIRLGKDIYFAPMIRPKTRQPLWLFISFMPAAVGPSVDSASMIGKLAIPAVASR